MNRLDKYRKIIDASLELDPWCKERGLAGYADEIIVEADELKRAISADDKENIREELGDVLLDWAHACLLAGRQYGFTMQEVIDESAEKLLRRKPYILKHRKVSLEEAKAIWKKAKEEESGVRMARG